jgi:GNAT superfamily N-acetyltransferase
MTAPISDQCRQDWNVFAELETRFYTAARPELAQRGEGWFGAISGVRHGELNVCGLTPGATRASASALLGALGDLPAVVFTSELVGDEVREQLVAEGFEVAATPEPLMRAQAAPATLPGTFRIAPATDGQIGFAISVTAEAHHIDPALLSATMEVAYRTGTASAWLAWEGDEPISAVWLGRSGETLGVIEMMTPTRHQRRGAGRQLLSAALNGLWTPETTGCVLLSTPAGRGLYESLGFVAADEGISCIRGLEDEVLAAIGQPLAG